MKALKPLLLAFSLAAFASAHAADDAKKNDKAAQAKPSMSQTDNKAGSAAAGAGATAGKKTFSELDRDNDGSLSMTEAAADKNAKQDFKKLDRNSDAKLSREEYEGRAAAGGTAKQPKPMDKPSK